MKKKIEKRQKKCKNKGKRKKKNGRMKKSTHEKKNEKRKRFFSNFFRGSDCIQISKGSRRVSVFFFEGGCSMVGGVQLLMSLNLLIIIWYILEVSRCIYRLHENLYKPILLYV